MHGKRNNFKKIIAVSLTSLMAAGSASASLATSVMAAQTDTSEKSGGSSFSDDTNQTFSISTSCTKGGTITPSKINVDSEGRYKIIVNANTGYTITKVTVDDTDENIGTGTTRYEKTFDGLDSDHIVTAEFTKNTKEESYQIRTSCDSNGTITPSPGIVSADEEYDIVVKANDNYVLDKVLDNGVEMKVENKATKFTIHYDGLNRDHDIIATFKKIDKTASDQNEADQNPRYYTVKSTESTTDGTNPGNAGTFELKSNDLTLGTSGISEDRYGKMTKTYHTVQEWSNNYAVITAKDGWYIKEVKLDNGDMLANGSKTMKAYDKTTGKAIAEYVENPKEYTTTTDLDGKTVTTVTTTEKDGTKTTKTYDGTAEEAKAQEDAATAKSEAERYKNAINVPVVKSFYLDQKSLLSNHNITVVYDRVKTASTQRGKITAYVNGTSDQGTVKTSTDDSGKRTVTFTAKKGYKFDKLKVDGKTVKTNGKSYSFPASDYDAHEVAVYFKAIVGLKDTTVKMKPGEAYTEWMKNAPEKVKWSVPKTSVLTYKKWGYSIRLYAKKPGTVKITGTVKGKKYSFNVHVSQYTLNKKKLTLGRRRTYKLKVDSVSASKVKWYSSNKRVATVSSNGTVKGVRKGKATITASVYGQKIKCTVTVK